MSNKRTSDEGCGDDEVARRRDDVFGRMIATPPKPQKPKPESAAGASPKKRGTRELSV